MKRLFIDDTAAGRVDQVRVGFISLIRAALNIPTVQDSSGNGC